MARSAGRSAALVGSGIMLSRLSGLIRQRVFAHYLGLSDAADAVSVAFRIPNLLQNLFGEGVLSASFIPVYARLVAEGKQKEAGRVAGATLALLSLAVAMIVAAGVAIAPLVVAIIVPGFPAEKQALVVTLVRILYPSAGLLVVSAWCLGVLNSHRRFFLSYAAPVVWNAAIIVAAILGRHRGQDGIAVMIAWGALAGSLLQVLVQLPAVLTLLEGLKLSLSRGDAGTSAVVKNFGPALAGRGVNQISAYIDSVISSLLGTGAAAAVVNAQLLYTLPVSLFGMSVSAAELPEMSSAQGTESQRGELLRGRLERAQHRIAFFIVPCAAAFLALGHVFAAVVFQSGRFSAADSRYVWAILAGSTVGLLAATLSRLSVSTFYALGDTRTPLRCAALRVVLATVFGFAAALLVPRLLGVPEKWGAVGLTITSGLAAWAEYALLRRRLADRVGVARFAPGYLLKLWVAALAAAAAAWGGLVLIGDTRPLVAAAVSLVPFCAVYGGLTLAFGIEAARALVQRKAPRA